MSATPGSLDFSKLASEATKTLESPAPAESKVKVAASESGIPAPNNDTAAETLAKVESKDPPLTDETEQINEVDESKTVTHETQEKVETPETKQSKEDAVLDLPDTAKVKVKIDGEVQTITVGDYKDILRKNATITQRMQTFAKSRDEFNAEVQKTLAELQARENALKIQSEKKDPLYETILNALKEQVEPKPRDPNEIVTLGDVQKEREKLAQEFEAKREGDKKAFEQQLIDAAQSLQEQSRKNAQRQAYLDEVRKVLKTPEYAPLVEYDENLEAAVIFHMQKSGAQSFEEAVEVSKDYLKEKQAKFKKHNVAQAQEQQKLAVKQKMESNSGTNPSIAQREKSASEKAKQFVNKSGKLDWNKMSADALARINAMN